MDENQQAVAIELSLLTDRLTALKVLFEAGLARMCVSNLYYVYFHTAKAMLASKGITSKTHEGVQRLLHMHFVTPKVLDASVNRVFSHLETDRIDADYRGLVEFNLKDVVNRVVDVDGFLESALGYLKREIPDLEEVFESCEEVWQKTRQSLQLRVTGGPHP